MILKSKRMLVKEDMRNAILEKRHLLDKEESKKSTAPINDQKETTQIDADLMIDPDEITKNVQSIALVIDQKETTQIDAELMIDPDEITKSAQSIALVIDQKETIQIDE